MLAAGDKGEASGGEAHLQAEVPQQVLGELAAVRTQDGALEDRQQHRPQRRPLPLLDATLQLSQDHLHQAVQLLRKQVCLRVQQLQA